MREMRIGAVLCGLVGAAAWVAGGGALAETEKHDPAAPLPPGVRLLEVRVPQAVPVKGRPVPPMRLAADGDLQGFVACVGEGAILTPAVEGRRVFAGDGVAMKAFDALDGSLLWTSKTDDSGPTAPAVSSGHVYFNTESCTLYGVEASTGARTWSHLVASSLTTTPAVLGDRVFVTGPGEQGGWKLDIYDGGKGRLLHTLPLSSETVTAPVASGGRLFLTLASGTVMALDLDGRVLWTRDARALAAPCPHEGKLLLGCGEEGSPRIACLDAETGAPDTREVATPAPNDGKRSAAGDPGQRPVAGGGAAPRPMPPVSPGGGPGGKSRSPGRDTPVPVPPAGPGVSAGFPGRGFGYEGPRPCVLGTTVAMSGSDWLLLQGVHGGDIRRIPLGAAPAGAPAAAGSVFVQAVADGRLLGIDPASGEIRFALQFTCGGKPLPLAASPAVSRGRAYLGTEDGRLLAVDLPDGAADGWPMWGGSPARAK